MTSENVVPPADIPPFFDSASTASLAASPSQPSALARLSLTDKLLLAQAVHHLGESPPNWASVSSLMLAHPLIKGPNKTKAAADASITLGRVYGSRECERAWTALMRANNLVASEEDESDNIKQRPKEAKGAPPRIDRRSQLALAQILYAERMEELRDSVKKKEEEFKMLIKRIDDLKSKKVDAELEEEIEKGQSDDVQNLMEAKASTVGNQEKAATRGEADDEDDKAEGSKTSTKEPEQTTSSSTAEPPTSPPTATPRGRGRPTRRGQASSSAAEASKATPDEEEDATETIKDDKAGEDKDEMDVEGVEDALGGRTGREEPDSKEVEEEETSSGSKRKRADEEGEDSKDAEASSSRRESKRTRSSTNASIDTAVSKNDHLNDEDEAESSTVTKKGRPAPTPRRSRRGQVKEADEEESVDGRESSKDVGETPTATSSKSKATPRRSTRGGRGSTFSRETSTLGEEGAGEEEAEADDSFDAASSSRRPSIDNNAKTKTSSRSARHSVDSNNTPTTTMSAKDAREKEKKRKANEKMLMQVWTEVSSHVHGNLFQNEVKESVSTFLE